MSRTLILLLINFAILSGCAIQPPADTVQDSAATMVAFPDIEQWLDLQQEVEAMDSAQVAERLSGIEKSVELRQLYYYGLLNQQLQSYGAWTVARDTFQKLQENEDLPKQQRQLAGILRQYNQNRINGYLRYNSLLTEQTRLQQALSQAEQEKQLLEQKIQALTALEAAISTRREE